VPISSRRRATLAALSALAVAGLAAGPAHAAVKPVKCDPEYLIEDSPGDAIAAPLGGLGSSTQKHAGPDNADITNVFLNFTKGVLTANIQLTDANLTLPAPTDTQGGLNYYLVYSLDGAVRFVRATNQTGTDMTYAYGTIDPDTGVYTTDGSTTGTLFEGKDGIVQIVVPDAAGGKKGTDLGGVEALADGITGVNDVLGINNHFDEAPDGADVSSPNGFEYVVHDCGTPPPATGGASARKASKAAKARAKARKRARR
jgi:hypothetical protein